jgi:hypothetical protein
LFLQPVVNGAVVNINRTRFRLEFQPTEHRIKACSAPSEESLVAKADRDLSDEALAQLRDDLFSEVATSVVSTLAVMRRHWIVMLRPVVLQATDRTVATPIRGGTHAVTLAAIVRPVISAQTINTGQFGYQAADRLRKREKAAAMIAAACITDRRCVSAVQEPTVP